MVSKRVLLGDRGILEAFVNVALYEPFREGRYMPLPKSCKIRPWSLTYKTETNSAPDGQFLLLYFQNQEVTWENQIKPGFHRLINSRSKIRILQSMCWDGKKKNVIVHRISEKDGAIPRINVMITPQGDNTLYRLTALLYDQSKNFNSKHCCERCLHGYITKYLLERQKPKYAGQLKRLISICWVL